MHRRAFLKSSGLAIAGTAMMPDVFVRMAAGASTSGRRTIVAIFLRGAVDGLNVVVPYGDPSYSPARPTIGLGRPGKEDGVVDLDGFFGLHPALASLVPLYRSKQLAFIHAVGSPNATRSHFDAQDFMETGTPGKRSTKDGFLGRALGKNDPARPTRGIAITAQPPRILAGTSDALTIRDINRFGTRSMAADDGFQQLYETSGDDLLAPTASDAFEARKILSRAASGAKPRAGVSYPRGPLGESLKQIAHLIRSDVGLEVAFTDAGGWDTHAGQGGARGALANNLAQLATSLDAFMKDLGPRMSDVTLVTMSEFGRTVRENGNRGTDHGHGGVMIVSGGGVAGGKVHGKWPELSKEALFEGRDLAITTDFRDVFSELLQKRMRMKTLASVFPGHRSRPLGIFS